MRRLCVLLFLVVMTGALTSCVGVPFSPSRQSIPKSLLLHKGFQERWISSDLFDIYGFVRQKQPGLPWVVYLEGDGYAWARRNRLSDDPTPYSPVAARLAALDHGANVLWLARPCQYSLSQSRGRNCTSRYWSLARYSEEILQALKQAILKAVRQDKIHLVGYSGGGALAALLAAQSDLQVLSLRTVAGNLDHKTFTDSHRVTPLRDSLNPLEVAAKLSGMPQIHYVSAHDNVVGKDVLRSWLGASGDTRCIETVDLKTPEHSSGWAALWKNRAGVMPACF